jgi:predicted aldo/keto reductase-like oxidoreductase
MIYNTLGKTGIKVSKICFGSLTMGPLQRNLSAFEGASLIEYAYEKGINFLDTAELYETYAHIRQALKTIPRDKFVIASKCYAYSEETARLSFEKALREIDTDYIDIFMLHEQMSEHTIRGHYEAIEYFLKMKQEGRIRAFGISTHYIAGVNAACKYPEIEIVHPITNVGGLGIQDGTRYGMESALKAFKALGGGIIGMKPFGGGNLLASVDACFDYILAQKDIDSIAFGMQSKAEIDYNVKRVGEEPISNELRALVANNEKKLQIADWCIGCGACALKCDHKALKIIDGMAVVDRSRCVLCGYCASVCPEFCIKVY